MAGDDRTDESTTEVEQLRATAHDIRIGTEAGHDAYRDAPIEVGDMRTTRRPPHDWLRALPTSYLLPFDLPAPMTRGEPSLSCDDAWGVDVFLGLREQRKIDAAKRGAWPTVSEVAEAMLDYPHALHEERRYLSEQHDDRLSPSQSATRSATLAAGADDNGRLARSMETGDDIGRIAFADALLAIDRMKSGNRPADGWMAALSDDVLLPFDRQELPRPPLGRHTAALAAEQQAENEARWR